MQISVVNGHFDLENMLIGLEKRPNVAYIHIDFYRSEYKTNLITFQPENVIF